MYSFCGRRCGLAEVGAEDSGGIEIRVCQEWLTCITDFEEFEGFFDFEDRLGDGATGSWMRMLRSFKDTAEGVSKVSKFLVRYFLVMSSGRLMVLRILASIGYFQGFIEIGF